MSEKDFDPRAAEYVLGTLRGAERDAFERELDGSPDLQQAVADWQARFSGLNDLIAPVAPPPRLWTGIRQRLGFERPRRAPRAGLWRGLALAAGAACLVLAALLVRLQIAAPPAPQPVVQSVVVRGDGQRPLWLVRLDWKTRTVSAEAVVSVPPGENQVHELWLLGGPDEAPLSLGLLPRSGRLSHAVGRLEQRRPSASGVAVSLEPAGGSPTGQPTGPVLYSAPLDSPGAI